MRIRCPHCQNLVEVVEDDPLREITCPSCGSSFHLISGDTTQTYDAGGARTIGHFELVQHLGQGYMGSVWKSHDTQLDRTVAIKIPRRENLAPEDIEQFMREARAAAQLSHPNIVPIHEVGREGDTVYIVADYVEGPTLADWLTGEQKLSFAEAAELCAKIADALEHAHGAGVIHRDLKPANIMLDANMEPHLMDFGLAKREAGEITMTMEGKVLGTPAYMAPEQAKGAAHFADRRADVYSLGVILFELLTGERPFRGNVRMLLHQVINDDAPSPRRYNARVPKDLETIVLKCLEKKPERRYDTAADLAADLRLWLAKEPIEARPIGRVQRGVRWCQRRPAIASMLCTTVLVTIVGFAGVTWQWRKAVVARSEAEEQRDRREMNFQKAVDAVDRLLVKVAEERVKDVPQMTEIRRSLLEDALEFYQGFLTEKTDDPDMLAEVGRAYVRVGDVNRSLQRMQQADEAYTQALIIFDELSHRFPGRPEYRAGLRSTHSGLASLYQDTQVFTKAEAETRKAIAIDEELVKETPGSQEHRSDLASQLNLLGNILTDTSRTAEAEEAYEKMYGVARTLAEEFPQIARYRSLMCSSLNNRANLHSSAKRYRDAEKAYREAIAITEALVAEEPDTPGHLYSLAIYYGNLGIALRGIGRKEEEVKDVSQKAFTMRQKLVTRFPGVPQYRNLLASSYETQASVARRDGQLQEAESLYRKGIEISEQLVGQLPGLPEHRYALAGSYRSLASLLFQMGRLDKSEEAANMAVKMANGLCQEFPEDSRYPNLLLDSFRVFSKTLSSGGRTADIITEFEKQIAQFQQLDNKLVQQITQHLLVARLWIELGQYQDEQGERATAIAAYSRGLDVLETIRISSDIATNDLIAINSFFAKLWPETHGPNPELGERVVRLTTPALDELISRFPNEDGYRVAKAYHLLNRGNALKSMGCIDQAEDFILQSIRLWQELVDAPTSAWEYDKALGVANESLGNIRVQQGRQQEAEHSFRIAFDLLGQLVVKAPGFTDYIAFFERVSSRLVTLLNGMDKPSAVVEVQRSVVDTYRQALAKRPESPELQISLATSLTALAEALHNVGDVNASEKLIQEATTDCAAFLATHPDSKECRSSLASCLTKRIEVLSDNANDQSVIEIIRSTVSDGSVERMETETGPNITFEYRLALADVWTQTCTTLSAKNRWDEAEVVAMEAINLWKSLPLDNARSSLIQAGLATAYHKLADVYFFHIASQDLPSAESLYRDAIHLRAKLLEQTPADDSLRTKLTWSYLNLGRTLRKLKRLDEAQGMLLKAIGLWTTGSDQLPMNEWSIDTFATATKELLDLVVSQPEPDEQLVQRVTQDIALLLALRPEFVKCRDALADSYVTRIQILAQKAEAADIMELLRITAAQNGQNNDQDSTAAIASRDRQTALADVLNRTCSSLNAKGLWTEAATVGEVAVECWKELIQQDVHSVTFREGQGKAYLELARSYLAPYLATSKPTSLEKAESRYREAIAQWEALLEQDAVNDYRRTQLLWGYTNLGRTLRGLERREEAQTALLKAVEVFAIGSKGAPITEASIAPLRTASTALAELCTSSSQLKGSNEACTSLLALWGRLVKANPSQVGYRATLAELCADLAEQQLKQGRKEEAKRMVTEASPVWEDLPQFEAVSVGLFIQLSEALGRIALVYKSLGDAEQAETIGQMIHLATEEMAKVSPGDSDTFFRRAMFWKAKNELIKAVKDFDKVIEMSPNAAGAYHNRAHILATSSDPTLRDGNQALADATKACELTHFNNWSVVQTLAFAYVATGDVEAALKWHTKALELLNNSFAKEMATTEARSRVAQSYQDLSVFFLRANFADEGEVAARKAVAIRKEALGGASDAPELLAGLAWSTQTLGQSLTSLGQMVEAEAAFREAAELWEQVVAKLPNHDGYATQYANTVSFLADVLQSTTVKTQEGIRFRRRAIAIGEKSIAQQPENHTRRSWLGKDCGRLAWVLINAEEPKAADLAEGLTYAQRSVEYEPDLSETWRSLGAAQYRAGNWQEALKDLQKAIELSQDDAIALFILAMTNWQLGNKEAARISYDEAVASMEEKKPEDPALHRIEKEAAVLLGISAKDESGG